MSRPAPPALTVRYDGSQRTFAAGHDVVVGRDLRADVRVAHPLISRAHVLLRSDQDRCVLGRDFSARPQVRLTLGPAGQPREVALERAAILPGP